jgi:hypothetical protein
MLPPLLALFVLAVSGFKEPLTWPAPSLSEPVRTFDVPAAGAHWYGVSTTVDCVLKMPDVPVSGTVKLDGCRNINLVGGEIYSGADPCSEAAHGTSESVGLVLSDWAGVAHVEGLKIHGRGFSDGIYATSTLPNSISEVEATWLGGFAACSEPPSGSINGWPNEHPDCFQTWAGPSQIRFDKVTCWTIYQGLNVDSNTWANSSGTRFPANSIDVRRTNVHLDGRQPNGRQCYTVWSTFLPVPTHVQDAFCALGNSGAGPVAPSVASNPAWWSGVKYGMRDGRDETTPAEAGIGYPNVKSDTPPGSPGGGSGDGSGGDGGGDDDPSGGDRPKGVSVRASAARRGLRVALAHGARVRVYCPSACTIGVRASVARSSARRLHLHGRRVGSAHKRLAKRGWTKLVVRFAHRHKLRHAKRLRVKLAFVVKRGGRTLRASRRLTLVRHT